jgi:hypothetical protein
MTLRTRRILLVAGGIVALLLASTILTGIVYVLVVTHRTIMAN